MTNPNYISYKDTAARVFQKDGLYYRYVFKEYQAEYDHLMQSGLYATLRAKGLIIAHEEIENDSAIAYKLLYPTQIAFQSYPFEWSYTQWRNVIIAYLQINQIALAHGMILKDATPYNFYISKGNAVLLDTTSFSFFTAGQPWLAYRQFCSELLSPIALMHYNGQRWSRITRTQLRGLPLNFVSKQLPLKSWLNSTTLLHIHLHAKYANAQGDMAAAKKQQATKTNNVGKGFTTEKLQSLMGMLLCSVEKWKTPYSFEKHWSTYYEQAIASEKYLADKEQTIKGWLEKLQPNSILDMGANTGKFSFIAAPYTKRVIALESDDICVDMMEAQIKKEKLAHVTALMQDLAETTPNLGVDEKEIVSIFTRAKSELVMALALEHHLHISNQISFTQIAEMFSLFSTRYLITEFVPATDSKVQLLVKDRNKDLSAYTLEAFQAALNKYFTIIGQTGLVGSERKLILLEKR